MKTVQRRAVHGWYGGRVWHGRIQAAMFASLTLAGCKEEREAMTRQPKLAPMAASDFFGDATSVRPLVPGTVPRGGAVRQFATPSEAPRPELSTTLLQRGQERFNIFCSVCHGRDGHGGGMVVQRGFPQAATYHSDRLRAIDDATIFSVITDGYQNMPAYGPLIPPKDRWAIVAYVRALQLSQYARIEDVPEEQRNSLAE